MLFVSCGQPGPAPTASAALPTGGAPLAAGVIAFDSDRGGNYEVFVMNADGSGARPLTGDAKYDSWWPRVSPDRRAIVFYRTPRGVHDTDFTKTALWAMRADGTELRELRAAGTDGWEQQGHAEWSRDGSQLAMFGGSRSNPQIFITTKDGRDPKQITKRGGVSLDPSWSPDGSQIAFVGCPNAVCFEDDYEIYVMPSTGGDARRLTSDRLRDHDPYFSPDGTRIAWLRRTDPTGPTGVWNIWIMGADGSGQHGVTSDAEINSKPEWSADGTQILFHRFEHGRGRWLIFAVAPDGRGLHQIGTDAPGNNEFPSAH